VAGTSARQQETQSSTRSHFFGDIPERFVTFYARSEDGTLNKASTALDRKFLPGRENESGWSRLFSNVNDFTKLMSMLANGVYAACG
jgi:hypothetical protein